LCNYLIMFGCGSGAGMYYNATLSLQKVADAKSRGMKVVVFDPLLSPSAERADEWVPIKPGTDAYAALAMMNVLINELGLFDAEHITKHTNGPYLIGPDGKYVRDQETQKPLVWNLEPEEAQLYDTEETGAPTLLGSFQIDGIPCKPAFQVLKDHVASYTPEEAEKVCDIRAETLRRITKEFGEASRIGSTIEI
ncbi:MAG: molybdopterin-dependent oxidoreductase, partial [Candidatus Binatia bacterium]|nr:molybdopterin-dependent oxidoreductase [Candidatus Binatia bacterium]